MALSDVIDQLLQQPSDPSTPVAILPPVAQTTSTPVVAGDPMVITPQTPPTVATPKKSDDWTPPAVTMTPPPVAAIPMGRSSGMIAAQPTPPTMGDVLNAPQKAPRRQMAILTTPSFG